MIQQNENKSFRWIGYFIENILYRTNLCEYVGNIK